MALEEVPEANLKAVNYHKVVLEVATPEDREQRQNHSQKSQWWKEVNERGNSRLPKRSTQAKNLDDDAHSAEQSDKDVSRRKRA